MLGLLIARALTLGLVHGDGSIGLASTNGRMSSREQMTSKDGGENDFMIDGRSAQGLRLHMSKEIQRRDKISTVYEKNQQRTVEM